MNAEELTLLGVVLLSLGVILLALSQFLIWKLSRSEGKAEPNEANTENWERNDGLI